MKEFLEKIDMVINILNEMEKNIDDLCSVYCNNKVEGESEIVAHLENTMIAMSHETATGLSFLKQNLLDTIRFIGFKNKYSQLSDSDLLRIVDSPTLTLHDKMELKAKFDSNIHYLESVKSIRNDWNDLFPLKSYEKIRKEIN